MDRNGQKPNATYDEAPHDLEANAEADMLLGVGPETLVNAAAPR